MTSPKNKPRLRRIAKEPSPVPNTKEMPPRALTTSLDSIHIQPRTPNTPRSRHGYDANDSVDELELSLLGEDDRRNAAEDLTLEEEQELLSDTKRPLSMKDKRAILLLVILCRCHTVTYFPKR